jgi:hypothetical protein
MGIAFNEVVVALLDEPRSSPNLRRFSGILVAATTVFLFIAAATPFSIFWFEKVSALPAHLADLARTGLWIALPLPALAVLQSWYQGAILYGRKTGGITESVVIYLVTSGLLLAGGVSWGRVTGLYIGLAAMVFSMLAQTAWLWYRSRSIRQAIQERDLERPPVQVFEPQGEKVKT